jgi:hypothetical protein
MRNKEKRKRKKKKKMSNRVRDNRKITTTRATIRKIPVVGTRKRKVKRKARR